MGLRLAAGGASWREFAGEVAGLDPRLVTRLDAGDPIVVASRFSTPTGPTARSSTIYSVHAAVGQLRASAGIDVDSVLPDDEFLDQLLREAPVQKSARLGTGSPIEHRFVQLDLRPSAPVILFLATGSGALAAEGFVQPFVKRLAELVMDEQAAMVVVKRWDRATRNEDLVGPLLIAMRRANSWVCEREMLAPMDSNTRTLLTIKSIVAGDSSSDGQDESRRLGQVDRTGRRMVDGQVPFHFASFVPPGFGRATMKRAQGKGTEKILYLDMPGCRPRTEDVADGLSCVLDENGGVVNQVENVRFVLARFGKPEWMAGGRIYKELARRRYSTERIRSFQGRDASIRASSGRAACRTIIDNLELYDTGHLTRQPGAGLPPVHIDGAFPPDGDWASPADFARIRRFDATQRERRGRAASLALVGIEAVYNGEPSRSRSWARPGSRYEAAPCLAFRRSDGTELAPTDHVLIPHDAIAESLAVAIINAGDRLQPALARQVTGLEEADAHRPEAELEEARSELDRLAAVRDGLVAQLGEVGADGLPLLRGGFLARAQQLFEEVTEQLIPNCERLIRRLGAECQPDGREAVDTTDPKVLPKLLASLRQPYDTTYSELWRRIVKPFVITTGPSSEHSGSASRSVRWHGAIRITGDKDHAALVIPFEGTFQYRRIMDGSSRFVDLERQYIERMLQGTPYDDVGLPGPRVARSRVAATFDIAAGHPLFECQDPAIVAAATTMLAGADLDTAGLSRSDVGFLEAVRRTHIDDRTERRWRRPLPGVPAAFYELANEQGMVTVAQVVAHCATTRGTVHSAFHLLRQDDPNWSSRRKQGYHLAPCPRCGSHDRRPAEILEPRGLVCRNCETDESGVAWPLDTYGQFLSG